MKPVFISILIFLFYSSREQGRRLSGIVEDEKTQSPLAGASITIYRSAGISGSVSNEEGRFSIEETDKPDSVRFSMIGYRSKVFKISNLKDPYLIVALEQGSAILQEVVVHAISAIEIVHRSAQKIPSFIPSENFESTAFYREIIQDSSQYYSVAEALYNIQFSVQKKSFKLKLEKGRSKEDVAYTRLFEDFHPGGGPEDAVGQSLIVRRPEFLDEAKLKNYIYKKESTFRTDDQMIYVISFDQKPGIHEALEKGRIYINADDYSVMKFEAANSPVGTPYIKSLRGTDKIFAEILHIDLSVRGWTRSAAVTKIGDKYFLSFVKMDYIIDYRQPKKGLDLSLRIHTDLLTTAFQRPVIHEITKGEEWKRKNLVANLPSDFDTAFWGSENILDPSAEVNQIIASISRKNDEPAGSSSPGGWQFLKKDFFIAYQRDDSITMVPISKCSWEDNESGGMMYKNIEGDFSMEAKIAITKRSNRSLLPDNGFQQAGIIVRKTGQVKENNFILSMGTGGNDIPKYFLRRTADGKSKVTVHKTEIMTGWFRIEKHEKSISIYKRLDEKNAWEKVDDFELDWLNGELQVGFSVMAKFAGDGPKQRPDMKAVFSRIQISGQ